MSCVKSLCGTGQKYAIPHGKPCLPSNCYVMPHAANCREYTVKTEINCKK